MAQAPPPPPPGQYPPQQYGAPPPGWQPPKPSHKGRNIALGCGGLVVLIIIIAVAAGGSKNSPGSGGNPGNNGSATSCSPAPCGNADGEQVSVSGLNRNLPADEFDKPEAGNHFVALNVTFVNNSTDSKATNPYDCKLRDAAGNTHDIAFSANPVCNTWQAVDLGKGSTLGPKPLCFEAGGAPAGALTLVWTPGFFNSPIDIPLQ
jgi:hypothetical protein